MDAKERPFRVLIVGAGFGGLTLANALEQAGIDYLVLEARVGETDVHGAGLLLSPNASRILDQLGCYQGLGSRPSAHLDYIDHRRADGRLILGRDDITMSYKYRHGYPALMIERRLLPEALLANLKHPEKVLNHKKVAAVEHSENEVAVRCVDGTQYSCDILIGADGIRSKVRAEMSRLAGVKDEAEDEIKAEYMCLYGVCSSATKLEKDSITVFDWLYRKGSCFLTHLSPDGNYYFQLMSKLDKTYTYPNIPRYSDEDTQEYVRSMSDLRSRDEDGISLGDLWKNITRYKLVAMEEGFLKRWTWGRIALVGDAVHKIAPNAGAGANAAVESAAVLANAINHLLITSNTAHPSPEAIQAALLDYQTKRSPRAEHITKQGKFIVRIHTLASPAYRFALKIIGIQNWLNPTNDGLAVQVCGRTVGADMIGYLPVPEQSLQGTMPFNPELKKESKIWRAILVLPLLGIGVLASRVLWAKGIPDVEINRMAADKLVTWEGGSQYLPRSVFHVQWLDDVIRLAAIAFSPSIMNLGPNGAWWQMLGFLTDYGTIYSIFLIEAARRSNIFLPASFVMPFLLIAQGVSTAITIPIFLSINWTLAPISVFSSRDFRLTDLRWTRSILPTLVLAHYVPTYIAHFAPDFATRYVAISFWQFVPIWISIVHYGLSRFMPDTVASDRLRAPLRDLTTIRLTVGIPAVLSAITWITTIVKSPFSLSTIFLPQELYPYLYILASNMNQQPIPTPPPTDFPHLITRFLQYDYLFFFTSVFIWLAYSFWDLRAAGMFREGWPAFLAVAAVMLAVGGPAVACASLFLCREQILATRTHSGAVTKDRRPRVEMRYEEKVVMEKKKMDGRSL